jgi:dephospho-CoA kinase
MALIGLTGGIGSGKSTVAAMLRKRNIPVIDSDQIARDLFEPGHVTYWKVRRTFGDGILEDESTRIDRAKLAAIIFSDESRRKQLNSITHPAVYKEVFKQVIWHWVCQNAFIFIDLPLLYESGYMLKYVSRVVVVACDRGTQIERIVKRNSYSIEQAEQRVNAQWSLEEKCKRADYVITNQSDLSALEGQVDDVLTQLRAKRTHWKPRLIVNSTLIGSFSILFCITLRVIRWVRDF